MQKAQYYHSNQAGYDGNRHRYHGNQGLNGNHGVAPYWYGATPPLGGGRAAQAYSTEPHSEGGSTTQLFMTSHFSTCFENM